METGAGLPTDLPNFYLNCSSNVSNSTDTHADAGQEIFSRELCIVLPLSIAVISDIPINNCSMTFLSVPKDR